MWFVQVTGTGGERSGASCDAGSVNINFVPAADSF